MNFIRINHQDGPLIFKDLKRAEILFIKNEGKDEIFVNIESLIQTEDERAKIESEFSVTLSDFIFYANPRIQIMNLKPSRLEDHLSKELFIQKGYEDEFCCCGIYVGWGVETFENRIKFESIDKNKLQLTWHCLTEDMNYYDERAKKDIGIIQAELEIIHFETKDEYWKYETAKMEGKA